MRLQTAWAIPTLALLAGCATLPSSGPTAADIRHGAESSRNELGFEIVDIDGTVTRDVAAETRRLDAKPTLSSLATIATNDLVGPGDILNIGIYEVGVSLFGGGGARDGGAAYDPSARGEPFPTVVVDRDGAIRLPYVGRLEVAGHTPADVQAMVERALKGKSQSPQALVSVRLNLYNTVYVAGEVRRPGRFDLSLQRERLIDAIALAGGSANSAEDTVVRFHRGNQSIEERLGRILPGSADDLVLAPGDRIELIKRPRSFLVFGATSKVAQVPFETGDLSLAEAVARAGGPNDALADAAAIFLFRYSSQGDAPGGKPIIYRLNMMHPASYFLGQQFAIHDKDVIYIANAAANRPAKLVAILNQLFSPFINAYAITR